MGLKYRWAMDLYEKKKWSKSLELLEQCKEGYRNQLDSLEKVYFKIAYANYNMKAYDFASMYFKDFTDNFGASPQAEEAAYMALLCDVKYVSDADLDQSQTKDIINALQTFINFYPESKYVDLCNGHIDELRSKLHVKAYDQVKQYYGMSEFKNAAAAAKIVVNSTQIIPKKKNWIF
jgi:outer membrane protein assembly factor BamD